jgi:hypothetical protein
MMLERFDFQRLIAEADFRALATARRERNHLVGGK